MKSEISAVEMQMKELIEECSDIVDGSYLKTEDARKIINLLIKGLEKCKELRESRDKWRNQCDKLKDYTQQIKKDNSDSSNENYLETRSNAGEGSKSEHMPVMSNILNNADNQSAEII